MLSLEARDKLGTNNSFIECSFLQLCCKHRLLVLPVNRPVNLIAVNLSDGGGAVGMGEGSW